MTFKRDAREPTAVSLFEIRMTRVPETVDVNGEVIPEQTFFHHTIVLVDDRGQEVETIRGIPGDDMLPGEVQSLSNILNSLIKRAEADLLPKK